MPVCINTGNLSIENKVYLGSKNSLLHPANHHIVNKWASKKKVWKPMFCILLIFFSCAADAQNCPQNIDFETGTFNGWTCYTGETDAINGENVISLYPSAGPVYNKHTMYNAGNMDTDPFGNFPVLCPNGSSHSVKLGSTEAGGQAEGISYEFTIPSNQNSYSITYHYAVVFQSPNHQSYEQPRMETEVFNVTDNSVISCASFSFIAIGTSIPGFEVSNLSDTINVLYKNWSAVSVDLSGNAGKTIRLFFKTADCTFRRHFGYAYIDINSECSGNITGATYCPDDTLVNLLAPYGFQSYAWYDSSVTEVMGTSQVLTLSPPPVSGTTFAVKLVPYDGYGCASTLFCRVTDSLTVTADAGKDGLSCNGTTLQIGTNPKAGLIYQWHPSEGLSNPYSANPFVTPVVTSNYVVVTTNSGGGCRTEDTVRVVASFIDASMQLIGKDAYCFGHGDSAVLQVRPVLLIDWFKDDIAINGTANLTRYRPTVSGTYHAVLANEDGCKVGTQKTAVTIDHDQAGITYPFRYAIENIPLRLAARPIGQTVLWNPAISLNDPESFNPEFTGDRDQLYHIVITSRGGCVTTDTQLVRAIKHVEIYVPTAFSPNGDGKNDYLHPVFRGISEVRKFCVFNRRGELCYQSSTELPGWDGNYKGVPQDPQTVVWLLECVGLDGVIYAQRGSSVLLR